MHFINLWKLEFQFLCMAYKYRNVILNQKYVLECKIWISKIIFRHLEQSLGIKFYSIFWIVKKSIRRIIYNSFKKTNTMPSNNDKYKSEELVVEALALRDLHLKLKDAIHTTGVRHQTKVQSRKEMISSSTVFTKAKDHVIRLAKSRDKKDAKNSDKPTTSNLRVVRVDQALASFLRLRERGLPADMYPDTLVTSNFTDWVVRTGRQNGREVKLFGTTDEFVKLFGEELKMLGSGPTTKNADGTETKTAVLDKSGNQINPFNMNKHMFIFAPHYPRVPKNTNGKYEKGRDVISRDEFPEIYDIMEREHALFTGTLGDARKRYRDAQNSLKTLQDKKDKALQVGDRSIQDSITRATQELKAAKQSYTGILNANRIPHNITL